MGTRRGVRGSGPLRGGARRGSSGFLAGALAALCLAVLPASAAGQGTACTLADSRGFTRIATGGGSIVYIQRPVIRCDDGTRIRADSAVIFTASNFTQLFRDVFYEDSVRTLAADTAQYFTRQGRLQAQGSVRITDKEDGSWITGERLLYLRRGDAREEAQLTVEGGRPHAVLYPRPDPDAPQGEPPVPYLLDADRIFTEGQDYFRATGRVEVHREDLEAYGEEMEYDGRAERMVLQPDGRIVSGTYELSGRVVTLRLPGEELEEIVARENAVLIGEDLRLDAELIRLFLEEGALHRLVATRPPERAPPGGAGRPAPAPPGGEGGADRGPRPRAVAEDFLLTADSIDVLAPGEVLDRLTAVGSARGESLSRDSLNTEDTPPLIRRDWIEGDTILATFVRVDPAAADSLAAEPAPVPEGIVADPPAVEADSASEREYALRRLVATGDARSLYRLEPSDTTEAAASDTAAAEAPAEPEEAEAPPEPGEAEGGEEPSGEGAAAGEGPERPRLAVHYVRGARITIDLEDGEVQRMEVEGQTEGIHLEPAGRRTAGAERGAGGGSR